MEGMIAVVEEMVKKHNEKVFSEDLICGLPPCCIVNGIPAEYKVHERRKRTFRAVIREVVRKFDSYVVRWKCVKCGFKKRNSESYYREGERVKKIARRDFEMYQSQAKHGQ